MKILSFFIFLFGVVQNISGQVSGKLVGGNGEPIQFANVLLLNNTDSSVIKAALTGDEGNYLLAAAPGKYLLRFSCIGYRSADFLIVVSEGAKMDLGAHTMIADATQLETVSVRAERPLFEQQAAGMVVNVKNSILTKGSSALEVLARSPGVVINRRDNSIELNGKSGVLVMLNGKLIRMSPDQVVNLLSGMSANDISKIELLTTPPANYDAEGSAGIINIVTSKNKKQGTAGGVSLTGGYGYREKGTANINLTHNKNNINLNGAYTFSHNSTYTNLLITSAQHMPFLGGDVFVEVFDTARATQNNHDGFISMDVKLTKKTTIGASVGYNGSKTSGTTFTHGGYNILPDSLLSYAGETNRVTRWNNIINTVYLEKVVGPGEKINIDLDYLRFNNQVHAMVRSSFTNKDGAQAGSDEALFAPGQQELASTTIQVGVLKVDYTKQLNKKLKLETGAKGAYTQSSSLSGIESFVNGAWTGSVQISNNIVMKESIGAVYAAVNYQVDQSASISGGLRYEHSYTNMRNPATDEKIFGRRLGAIFPSIFFTKKIAANSELQLSYTKRISRPSYNDLASYVGYSDPTAVYTGNPFLKPTITNNVKLGYNYKAYAFSVLFSRDVNAIARYQITESPAADMLFISPQNVTWQNNITFQATLPWKISNWWRMSYNLVGGSRRYKVNFTQQPFEKRYFGYSLNFTQSFQLPRNYAAEISGWYNNTSYNGTRKIDGYGVINIGFKKELGNNAGTLQLSVSDLLRNEQINIAYGTLTEEAFAIRNHVTVNTESTRFPIIKLTYSRLFGSGGSKTQSSREDGSKEEKERAKKD